MKGIVRKLGSARHAVYTIPWCVPALDRRQLWFIVGAHLSGRVITGRESDRFVDDLRAFLGVPFVVPTNRGRTAIELAVRGLDLKPGDEVIVPSYLCTTALDGVRNAGATPTFADVDEQLHVSPETIQAALSPRTRCILVAHLYGEVAPIGAIERFARERGLHLIDDAAQSLGASHEGRLVGTFGSAGIVSSGPGKPISGPAGGALVTSDRSVYDRALAVHLSDESIGSVLSRTWGFLIWRWGRKWTLPVETVLRALTPPWPEPGHVSAHLSNLDAGIMRRQLGELAAAAAQRRGNVALARRVIGDSGARVLNGDDPRHVATKLVAVLAKDRLEPVTFLSELAEAGVEGQGWYKPLHLLSDSLDQPDLPVSEELWERVVCLPLDGAWERIPKLQFSSPAPVARPSGVPSPPRGYEPS